MKSIGIMLTDELAQAAYLGQKTVTRRPIRPNPRHEHIMSGDFGPAVIRGAGTAEVGTLVWIRECWAPATSDGPVAYRAAGDSLTGDGARWRPSVHMPREVARTWGVITSVAVSELCEIDDEEARREGFVDAEELVAALRNIYPRKDFFWRIEWTRIERPTLEAK